MTLKKKCYGKLYIRYWWISFFQYISKIYHFFKKERSITMLFETDLPLLRVKGKSLSRVQLFVTPWTTAYQATPSTWFSMQEYWSELPFPSPEDLPNPGTEPGSPAL